MRRGPDGAPSVVGLKPRESSVQNGKNRTARSVRRSADYDGWTGFVGYGSSTLGGKRGSRDEKNAQRRNEPGANHWCSPEVPTAGLLRPAQAKSETDAASVAHRNRWFRET